MVDVEPDEFFSLFDDGLDAIKEIHDVCCGYASAKLAYLADEV